MTDSEPKVIGPRRTVGAWRDRSKVEAKAFEAGVRGNHDWLRERRAPMSSAIPTGEMGSPVPKVRSKAIDKQSYAPHLVLDKGASCIQAEALLSSSHQHQPVSRVPRFDRFGIARSSREKMLAKRAYFSLFDRQLIRNSMSRSTGQRAVNFSS